MTFKIAKPTTVPARGTQLLQPVEKLNIAMNMLGRVQGDPMQSAARLGELVDVGVLQFDQNGLLVPGPAITGSSALSVALKNRLINSNLDYWQRRVSLAGNAIGYVADRWSYAALSMTGAAMARGEFAPGDPAGVRSGARYYASFTSTGNTDAAAHQFNIIQRVESVRTLAGSQALASFMAFNGNAGVRDISVEFRQTFGSGGAPSAQVSGIGSMKVPLQPGWNEVTVPVSLPSISGKTIGTDNNDWVGMVVWFSAGTNHNALTASLGPQSGTVLLAGFQLEPGTKLTSFEPRPLGLEMLLCQRYYEKSYNLDVLPGTAPGGAGRSATFNSATGLGLTVTIPYAVSKRAPGAATVYSNSLGTAGSVTQDDGSNVAVSSVVAGMSSLEVAFSNSVGRFGGRFHWTVDSEL